MDYQCFLWDKWTYWMGELMYHLSSLLSESSSYILLVTIPEDNTYATLRVGKKSALQMRHWSPSISVDVPTTVIHTMVTNSSRSLMESIKPCKYLQDKKPSRQSIPIYTTMEAVFHVRKINNVRFGGKERGERKNNLRWHSTIFHSKCSFSIHHPDHYDGSLFFQSPRLTSLCAPPAGIRNHGECIQWGSRRHLLKKIAVSGCDRNSKAREITQRLPVEVFTGGKVKEEGKWRAEAAWQILWMIGCLKKKMFLGFCIHSQATRKSEWVTESEAGQRIRIRLY